VFKLTPNCLHAKSETELRGLFREANRAARVGRLATHFNEAVRAFELIQAELVSRDLTI